MPELLTRLVYLTFVFHWESGQHIELKKSFSQLCVDAPN